MYPNGKPKTVAINHRGIHIQDDGHVCLFCEAFPVAVTDDGDDDDSSEYYSTSSTTSSIGSLDQPHEGSGSNRYKRRGDEDEEQKEPVIDEDKAMEETEEDEGRERKGRRKKSQKQQQNPTKRRRRRKRAGTSGPTTPHNTTNMLQREVMLQYLPIAVCQFDIHGKLHYQNPEALHIFGWPTKTRNTPATSNDHHACDGGGGGDDGIDKEAVRKPTDVEIDRTVEKKLTIQEEVVPQDKKEFESEATSEDGGRSYDNDFVNRFVDRTEGIRIFERLISGNDVNVEALVHTKLGPGWNAIHARLGKPMESGGNGGSGGRKKSKSSKKNENNRSSSNNKEEEEPYDRRMILFIARDISEIITAKREMQLSLERAEFFAIMVSIY